MPEGARGLAHAVPCLPDWRLLLWSRGMPGCLGGRERGLPGRGTHRETPGLDSPGASRSNHCGPVEGRPARGNPVQDRVPLGVIRSLTQNIIKG